MKGHMQDGKFHPHKPNKGVRSRRDTTKKTEGVRKSRNRFHPKGYKPPTFGKKKPAGTWEITKTAYNPHIHKFDQLDYDSGDNTERGHCEECGKWIDTSTGVIEKVEGDDDFVRKARVTGEDYAQFFRDEKSGEITTDVGKKWEAVIVKESMDKISKGFALQVLDQLTNNFELELENVDYSFIKEKQGFAGVQKELMVIRKRDLESAKFFLDDKFGYGEPDPRPENKGQEIAQKLLEPFEKMKDEQLAKLKTREADYVKSKKIITDATDDLFNEAVKSLKKGL